MRWFVAAACAVALVGCSRSSAPAEGPAARAPAPPPPTPEALKALFPAGAPTVPAPFGGVRPDMPRAEALARVPALARDTRLVDPAWPALWFAVDLDPIRDRVARLSVELPAGARATLAAAWGPAVAAQDPLGRLMDTWLAPEDGLRATLTAPFGSRRLLVLDRYAPATEQLARIKGRFGFERQLSLLGADSASIAAAFGDAWQPDAPGGPWLSLPPTEHAAAPLRVRPRLVDGRVAAFTLDLDYERRPVHREALRAALAMGRGAPTATGDLLVFPGARRVTVQDLPELHTLRVQVTASPSDVAAAPPRTTP